VYYNLFFPKRLCQLKGMHPQGVSCTRVSHGVPSGRPSLHALRPTHRSPVRRFATWHLLARSAALPVFGLYSWVQNYFRCHSVEVFVLTSYSVLKCYYGTFPFLPRLFDAILALVKGKYVQVRGKIRRIDASNQNVRKIRVKTQLHFQDVSRFTLHLFD
jgi:hypothetical protein